MKTAATAIFMSNGNTAVFDEEGEQIPELQRPWIRVFVDWLETQDVEAVEINNIIMPDGSKATWHPESKNWSLERAGWAERT